MDTSLLADKQLNYNHTQVKSPVDLVGGGGDDGLLPAPGSYDGSPLSQQDESVATSHSTGGPPEDQLGLRVNVYMQCDYM